MKQFNSQVLFLLRLITLLSMLCGMAAWADDYSEVSQLLRAGKLPEAMARADQFLAAQPKDPQMRFIKGVIQRDSGKTGEAIATFTRLTEDYPELPEPYNNLAVLFAGQGQFDKARSALEMAIRTNPSYATAHENLGDIYAKLASQAYNKALQLDNANPAIAPKLALIREIFSTGAAKPQRPASASAGTQTASQPVASAGPATKPTTPIATAPAANPPLPVVPAAPKPVAPAPVAAISAPATAPNPPIQPTPGAAPAESASTKDVENAVRDWANAWSARDVRTYLAAYGNDFNPPGTMSRKTWEEERQQRIASKASISVKVSKLSLTISGTHASARFLQDYKAGGLAVSSRKTLDFAKVGERWLIVKETVEN